MFDSYIQQAYAYAGRALMFVTTFIWKLLFSAQRYLPILLEKLWKIVLPYIISFIATVTPWVILFVLIVAVNLLISVKMEQVARMKGHRRSHAFALCFWFGIFGYVYVLCLPDLNEKKLHELSKYILSERQK